MFTAAATTATTATTTAAAAAATTATTAVARGAGIARRRQHRTAQRTAALHRLETRRPQVGFRLTTALGASTIKSPSESPLTFFLRLQNCNTTATTGPATILLFRPYHGPWRWPSRSNHPKNFPRSLARGCWNAATPPRDHLVFCFPISSFLRFRPYDGP